MGGARRRLSREDLEAMREEFVIGGYDEPSRTLDDDLHQVGRMARLGVSLEEWARAQGVPRTYARALRRVLDHGSSNSRCPRGNRWGKEKKGTGCWTHIGGALRKGQITAR